MLRKGCLLTGVILFVLFAVYMWRGCTQVLIGIDVSPEEANRTIMQRFEIPTAATKVRFRSHLMHTFVNAWMSEDTFKKWAKQKGWHLVDVGPNPSGAFYIIDEKGDWRVESMIRGWGFSEDGEVGYGGDYDTEREMASVFYFVN